MKPIFRRYEKYRTLPKYFMNEYKDCARNFPSNFDMLSISWLTNRVLVYACMIMEYFHLLHTHYIVKGLTPRGGV